MKAIYKGLVCLTIFACLTTAVNAESIAINFTNVKQGDLVLGAADVAGWPATQQANWNNTVLQNNNFRACRFQVAGDHCATGTEADIADPTAGVLVDANGNTTSVTIDWSAPGSWRTPGTDAAGPSNNVMHGAGLDTIGGDDGNSLSVTMGNLNSFFSGPYNVIAYVGADADGRLGQAQLNGGDDIYFITNTRIDQPGGHTRATATSSGDAFPSNFILYADVTGDSFTFEYVDTPTVLLHGIQISSVPEPTTGILALFASMGVMAIVRRRR